MLHGRVLLLVALLGVGCSGVFSTGQTVDPEALPDVKIELDLTQTVLGLGPGEACEHDGECRIGLACVEGLCAVVGAGQQGNLCILSDDCGTGLVCSLNLENLALPKSCVAEGDGELWDICTSDADCKKGFYCQLISFSGTCQPAGTGDVGTECEDAGDCLAGLYCGVDGRCGIMGAQLPVFLGQQCEPSSADTGTARVFFEVPRKGQPLKDFYRLPFPNDIRIVKGKLDLSGHPTPGPGVVGFDVTARVIEAMQSDLSAFGTNPVTFFRFSKSPDLNSIATGEGANVLMLDLTDPQQSGYGQKLSLSWVASTGRGKYICSNYLAVYVPWARPLAGDRTYAVILLDSILTDPGKESGAASAPFVRDGDFDALLSDLIPEDEDLKGAWEKYSRLRQFLSSVQAQNLGITKSQVIGATLFTTYDPTVMMAKFKEEMDTIALPQVSQAVLCDGQAVSPCDDGLVGSEHRRGCMAPDPAFHEIQGLVKLSRFQKGEVPYIDPKDGGGIEWDALGRPIVQGFEEVCFSLTIPKGTAPAGGWPVVLYGHGTGGNYRSHISEGITKRLSDLKVWNKESEAFDRPVAFAVMGWDQVLHGPRIGPAPLDPDTLVFNFRNPRAALGNFYQAASEAMVLPRLLASWAAGGPAVGELATAMNPLAVLFLGHSQGGISGPLAMPFVDIVTTMVISGTGGGLVESLLSKQSPVNVKEGVIVSLQDENVGRTHPVLALLQNYYDPVDPINYADLLFYSPYLGHKVRTFHPLGLTDMHTPPKTMKALSQAMRALLAKAPALPSDQFEPYSGVQQIELPYTVSGGVTVEYGLPPDDGHFVIFHNEEAIRHYTNFLGTAVLDPKPELVL